MVMTTTMATEMETATETETAMATETKSTTRSIGTTTTIGAWERTTRTTTRTATRKKTTGKTCWTMPREITSASMHSITTDGRESTIETTTNWIPMPAARSKPSSGSATVGWVWGEAGGAAMPEFTGRPWTPWRRKKTPMPAGPAGACSEATETPTTGTKETRDRKVGITTTMTTTKWTTTTTRSTRPSWTETIPSTWRPLTCPCGNGSHRNGPGGRSSANSEPF
mmetsp:Transcript_31851/g.74967  ORF Transcript_31851/g.74967 Transcript_31851/m.74967 type:complete len:225 (-) Transcript_31851:221-895(-)